MDIKKREGGKRKGISSRIQKLQKIIWSISPNTKYKGSTPKVRGKQKNTGITLELRAVFALFSREALSVRSTGMAMDSSTSTALAEK